MTASTAPIMLILDRLDGVVKSGRGWRSECPSCGGRKKKLGLAEASNGSVLLNCFGGCSPVDVLAAVGLSLAQLFPRKLEAHTREQRLANRRALRDAGVDAAITVLAHEAFVVAVAGFDAARGKSLSSEDLVRLELALQRVEDAKLVLCER